MMGMIQPTKANFRQKKAASPVMDVAAFLRL